MVEVVPHPDSAVNLEVPIEVDLRPGSPGRTKWPGLRHRQRATRPPDHHVPADQPEGPLRRSGDHRVHQRAERIHPLQHPGVREPDRCAHAAGRLCHPESVGASAPAARSSSARGWRGGASDGGRRSSSTISASRSASAWTAVSRRCCWRRQLRAEPVRQPDLSDEGAAYTGRRAGCGPVAGVERQLPGARTRAPRRSRRWAPGSASSCAPNPGSVGAYQTHGVFAPAAAGLAAGMMNAACLRW